MVEHQDVLGHWRAGETALLRRLRKRGLQCAEREEIERGIAPLQHLDRLERMTLECLRELGLEHRTPSGCAEGAVAGGAPGAAGDLRELGRVEAAGLLAIPLPVRP